MSKINNSGSPLNSYMLSIHRTGRISLILALIAFWGMAIVLCKWGGGAPSLLELLAGCGMICGLAIGSGIGEFMAFLPQLGAGATYISFLTGNVSNMKLPSVIGAMKALDVETGTEEHEVLSVISACISSFVVIILLGIVVAFTGVLKPFFEYEPIQPAFNNVIPALYGILFITPLTNMPKVIIPTFLCGIPLVYFWGVQTSYMSSQFGCMIIAVVLACIFHKMAEKKAAGNSAK